MRRPRRVRTDREQERESRWERLHVGPAAAHISQPSSAASSAGGTHRQMVPVLVKNEQRRNSVEPRHALTRTCQTRLEYVSVGARAP
jgi:hypothetical protein